MKRGSKQRYRTEWSLGNVFVSVATVAIVLYVFAFFVLPFKPLAGFFQHRFQLIYYFFDPSILFENWFGNPAGFYFSDRLPIYVAALFCIAAADGAGAILLRLFKNRLTDLSTVELYVFRIAVGLNVFSLFLLSLGLCGQAGNSLVVRITTAVFAVVCVYDSVSRIIKMRNDDSPTSKTVQSKVPLVCSSIFAILLFACAPLPPVEYDVVSYHIPGVKTAFLSGSIGFSDTNVYTNMPFGAEMYYLWGMCICGEWYQGSLVGKVLIASTAILTAIGIGCFCKRFFSTIDGNLAALFFLANPWTYYIFVTGLIDGVVCMYLFFAIYVFFIAMKGNPKEQITFVALSGFLAGAAAACKYPAALFVVIPIAVGVLFLRRRFVLPISVFVLAVLVACGLWYAKNAAFTGNPTYPLLYNVFGDATGTWTPKKNLQWTTVHSPHGFGFSEISGSVSEVLISSDYLGPVLIPLVLIGIAISFMHRKTDDSDRNVALIMLVYIGFYLACWWLLTHRIDRFWIPLTPLFVVFAAVACKVFEKSPALKAFIVIAVIYGLIVAVIPCPGKYNRLFLSMPQMKTDYQVRVMPWTLYFNANPPTGKLLLIGEAKAFDFDCPVLYSTCFDTSVFEEIMKDENGKLKSPQAIRDGFLESGITEILVDWNEISRFKSPGNYGFSDFIEPTVFYKLTLAGILTPIYPPDENLRNSPQRAYHVIPE